MARRRRLAHGSSEVQTLGGGPSFYSQHGSSASCAPLPHCPHKHTQKVCSLPHFLQPWKSCWWEEEEEEAGREGVSLFSQGLRPTVASRIYLSGQPPAEVSSGRFWLGCSTMRSTGSNAANPELHMSALPSLPISKDFLCTGHCSRKMHSTQMTERARIKPKKPGEWPVQLV